MKKVLVLGCIVAVMGLGLPPGTVASAPTDDCGLTTLDGVVEFSAETVEAGRPLKCGPGQKIVVRKDLAAPKSGRAQRRVPLTSFVTIADIQLADEESPLRAEWADKCEEHPATAAFRPHETLVPALMNAHVNAASRIIKAGSPVLDDAMDFAIGLGDLADNNQYNEIRWVIDIFDGGKLINPDSGDDGYHGVQATDPLGAHADPLVSPVEGKSLRDLGNEPFWAKGLRRGANPFPWYSIPGNHDLKVQGTVTNTEQWRTFANTWAQGGLKFTDVSPDHQQRACQGGYSEQSYYTDLFTNPGGAKPVPADEDRHLVEREQWAKEHFTTSGVPKGHGFNRKRCTNPKGEPLHRLCYSWTDGKFHFIGLDSNPDEGLEDGNIDRPQWNWLKRELRRSNKISYTHKGEKRRHRNARNRMVVLFSHHPTASMHNGEGTGGGGKTEQQVINLLLRFPNVILHSAGHTHQNKIWPRRNKELGTAYWEVNTAAIVDVPHQSRTIEVANNRDGTISLFAVVFDALAGPDPRLMDWAADDPTSEKALAGAKFDVNEDWLASAAREIGIFDPQQDLMKVGTPKDRNAELLLRAPRWLRR
jgi:metallophosphoesterase (TIGR03767 family)